MRNWICTGEKIVEDETKRMIRLEYYLEEDMRDVLGKACLYGIRILMYREIEGQVVLEKGSAPAISYSREFVEALLDRLKRMSVTPTSLLEIVDDEMSAVYI